MIPRSPGFRHADFSVTVEPSEPGEDPVTVACSNRSAEDAAREVSWRHPGKGDVVARNVRNPHDVYRLTRRRIQR